MPFDIVLLSWEVSLERCGDDGFMAIRTARTHQFNSGLRLCDQNLRVGKRRELAGRLPGFALIAVNPTLEMDLPAWAEG